MSLGRTHWSVDADVREAAEDVRSRFGGSRNSYEGHGAPSGHSSRRVVDHWAAGGRGDPLPEAVGDAMCSWILGQNEFAPHVLMIIWWAWWWRPRVGWKPYPGLHGTHKGRDGHVHVVYG